MDDGVSSTCVASSCIVADKGYSLACNGTLTTFSEPHLIVREHVRIPDVRLLGHRRFPGRYGSVLSNHLHVVLRSRPDVVQAWSDQEVARRWLRLFPKRRNADGTPAEPTQAEIDAIVNDPEALSKRQNHPAWSDPQKGAPAVVDGNLREHESSSGVR